jgi:hypothetical protein
MPLETGTFINSLSPANPAATDGVAQGDDHLRLLKSTIKSTFPNITGAVTPTQTELNHIDGVTSPVQTQLNTINGSVSSLNGSISSLDGSISSLNASLGGKLDASSYTAADIFNKVKTLDGAGSGLDADLLDGAGADTASTGNTLVKRDTSGDINARLFRSEYDSTNSSIGYIMTQVDTAANNYMRPSTVAQVKNSLGLSSGAFNTVGSYAFLVKLTTTEITSGSNHAGSTLRSSGFVSTNTTTATNTTVTSHYMLRGDVTVSGTWRAMGSATDGAYRNWQRQTLFIRIS